MSRHIKTSAGAAFTVFAIIGVATEASAIALEAPFGILDEVSGLAEYVGMMYTFVVGAVGIVAASMIMVNGLRWVAAAGNAEQVSEAKDGVTSAITGLLLALASYVILGAINPAFIVLSDPEIDELKFGCEGDGRFKIAGALAGIEPALASRIVYGGSSEEGCIQEGLFDMLVEAATILEEGTGTVTLPDGTTHLYGDMRILISSAYRSIEKQEYLYQCYVDYLSTGTCACGSCNLAGVPPKEGEPRSGHLVGNAVDISWVGSGWTDNAGFGSSDWHGTCMVDESYGTNSVDGKACTADLYNSVYALNTLMAEVGAKNIRKEWWHHQPGAGGGPGNYTR